jgi:hypothetical protein
MREKKQFTQNFVLKPEGKRKLAGSRPRCDDNIKIYLQEINGRMWAVFLWLRPDTSDGLYGTRHESTCSIKC